MRLEIHDGKLWQAGIEVIDGPLKWTMGTMERMCSRWNAFEERSLLKEVAQAASAAAEQIEHLHNLLGYNTEHGDTAVINIRRALSEIEYR